MVGAAEGARPRGGGSERPALATCLNVRVEVMQSRVAIAAAAAVLLAAGAAHAQTHTLQDSLAAAYANNPTLQAARANLRATDESVPGALAGWRPQVTVSALVGPTQTTIRAPGSPPARPRAGKR